MSVVVTDGGGGEKKPDAGPAIAKDVGHLEATTEHHAAAIAAHAEKLTNLEGDIEWSKTRIAELEQSVTEVPAAAISELREQLAELKHDLMAQTAALSEAIVSNGTPEAQTEAPPAQHNEADKEKPVGGLRKALHRLL